MLHLVEALKLEDVRDRRDKVAVNMAGKGLCVVRVDRPQEMTTCLGDAHAEKAAKCLSNGQRWTGSVRSVFDSLKKSDNGLVSGGNEPVPYSHLTLPTNLRLSS